MDFEQHITLENFIGQAMAIDLLKISIEAAKMRNEDLGHFLLSGPRGSGKHTLVNAIINESNANIRNSSFNAIRNASDLTAILTNLEEHDFLVLENFDAIPQDCVELLCSAMDDFCINIVIGKGPGAQSICLDLVKFTLIGIMDTKIALPQKLVHCFSNLITLCDYSTEELVNLSQKYCENAGVLITNDAARALALYAEGSNRRLTNALKKARDFAIVTNQGVIDHIIAQKAINCMVDYDIAL